MVYFAVHFGAGQFGRCSGGPVERGQPVHNGLDDNHGPIHNQPEVDGPEAEQVARHVEHAHQADGEEHGQRNDRGHHQPRPPVAQKQHQHEQHNQRALGQVLGHGADGLVHELGAVQKRLNHHSFGQRFLDGGHARLHGPDDFRRVGPFEHEHHRAHHFAFLVAGHQAVAHGVAEAHVGHVAHQNRYAAAGAGPHHHAAHVFQGARQPFGADEVGHRVFVDVGPAGVLVVLLQGVVQLPDSDVVAAQALGVHGYFVLLDVAAEATHVGHAGRAQQLPAHQPVLQRAQLGGRILVFVALFGVQHILVNLAQARRDGSQLRHAGAGRNLPLGVPEALRHLVAGPVHVRLVGKHDGDHREAKAGKRAHLLHVGDGGNGLLDGKGHEPLHVRRAQRGGLGDDLHLVVGDVGHGINGQVRHRVAAPRYQRQREQANEQLVGDGKLNDTVEHVRKR